MLRRIPLIVIALGLSFASPVFCVDPNRLISQYAHTSWRVQDGFEVGTTIVQTPDGYLWLQTPEELFRFDGVRFVPFVPKGLEILIRSFASLLGFRDGSLWIGTPTYCSELRLRRGRRYIRSNL